MLLYLFLHDLLNACQLKYVVTDVLWHRGIRVMKRLGVVFAAQDGGCCLGMIVVLTLGAQAKDKGNGIGIN